MDGIVEGITIILIVKVFFIGITTMSASHGELRATMIIQSISH